MKQKRLESKECEMPLKAPQEFLIPRLVIKLLFLLLAITIIITCTIPIVDGDIWFNLYCGKYLVSNHTLIPDHQVFTWTPINDEIIYGPWLAQVFFYLCYRIGGLTLLFVFRYFVFFLYLLFFLIYIKKHNLTHKPLTWLIFILSLIILLTATTIKPNIFSCLFISVLVFVWYYIKTDTNKRYYLCYLLPVIILIWVNTHGGWIFGYAFLCVICAGEIINIFISPGKTLDPVVRKHFFIAFFFSTFAILVNPYGWKYPFYVINIVLHTNDIQNHLNTLSEYRSLFKLLSTGSLVGYNYSIYLLTSLLIIGVLLWPQFKTLSPDWTVLLPVILFTWLYVKFIRTMFFFAPVFAFSSFYLLSTHHRIAAITSLWPGRILQISLLLLFGFFTVYINIMSLGYSGTWFGFGIGYAAPVEEANFIKNHFHGSKIGNDYDSGSYLTWILWPEVKTFIDARYFPFENWFDEYLMFINGIEVEKFLQNYNSDIWCIKVDANVISYFVKSPEWDLIFYGPACGVFIKNGARLPGIQKRIVAKTITNIRRISQVKKIINFTMLIEDFDTAQNIIENTLSIKRKPQLKSFFYTQLGNKKYNNKKINEASAFFVKALNENPENIDALFGMGVCFTRKGNFLKAEAYCREALRINPDFQNAKKLLDAIIKAKTTN